MRTKKAESAHPRSHAEVDADVSNACAACAGSVAVKDGRRVCALPEALDCALIRGIDIVRKNDAAGQRMAKVMTPQWIASHVRDTSPLALADGE